MSLAELKAELQKLTPAELTEVEKALQQVKAGQRLSTSTEPAKVFGSLEGVMKFGPGWDQPESAATWNAMRDDSSL